MRTLPPDARPGSKGQFARAVGAFVPKVTAAVFEKFGFHSAEIMAAWETIVGADLAKLTRPQTIKWPRGVNVHVEPEDGRRSAGATLIVACDPAFGLEVSYRHQEIIERINRYFGYRAIAQLKVHQVPRTEATGRINAAAIPKAATNPISRPGGDLSAALEALGRSVAASAGRGG